MLPLVARSKNTRARAVKAQTIRRTRNDKAQWPSWRVVAAEASAQIWFCVGNEHGLQAHHEADSGHGEARPTDAGAGKAAAASTVASGTGVLCTAKGYLAAEELDRVMRTELSSNLGNGPATESRI